MTSSTLSPLAVLAAASVASAVAVASVRRWAASRLLDVPNERSSHEQPTPRGGGLGIVAVVVIGYGILVGTHWPAVVWLGALAVAAVSLIDDLRQISPVLRLAAQVLVGLALVVGVSAWQSAELPFIGVAPLGPLGAVFALVWVVGLSNAYNFMDGVDAMAGVQAVVAGTAWVVLGQSVGEPELSAVGALVAGATAGFLWHNWPPARIFMGDVGSVFLGYVFAALPIVGAVRAPRLAVAGLLVVWPFVFDTAFTLLRRVRRREHLLTAHRSHLYQRLTRAGWSHRSVSLLYGALALAGGLLAVGYASGSRMSSIAVVLGVPALASALVLAVLRAERGMSIPGVPSVAREGGDA